MKKSNEAFFYEELKKIMKKMAICAITLFVNCIYASVSFGGIGVLIYQVRDGVKVAEVVPGTPAAETKLQANDVVIAIDGESLKGKFLEYQMVKVEAGGTLKIGPGEMKIGVIQLESGSSIEFTNPGQGTIIWTNGKTLWKTSIVNENQELVARDFKLIQLSDKDMFIEGDWAGTIHAAKADLIMGQTNKLMYGRFVGKM
ncbi:PDZ domain-containing protein [uncultured Fibrobacter sp.]|uniref:PDZ domain-containing protein n=1 Tax=uncultured Fibrobacter sp. TaxID=261512 RepID=UPI0026194E80|nr:PDZ domain-containing protein [uncultured Fibrobacter sp.]